MVCIRCKMIVEQQLADLAIHDAVVKLGEVELSHISNDQLDEFKGSLIKFGLVVLDDKKGRVVEKIKAVVVESIHYREEPLKINFSEHLSRTLNYEYTYMANLFSEVEGTTIEHYLIVQRIERVKELILYQKLSLLAISYQLNYSSVAHLCTQFKNVTGLTPSVFRKIQDARYRHAG
jgi:AraC-like DNA-binding protein